MTQRPAPAPSPKSLLQALVLGTGDSAVMVATVARPTVHAPDRRLAAFVVVHRDHGTWTHVYTVEKSGRRALGDVRLERIWEGERMDAAHDWVVGNLIGRAAVAA